VPQPPALFTRSFVALLIAQTAFGLAYSTFILLPKFLAVELAAGAFEIGAVTAAFGAATTIFTPLVGTWVDRIGRRRYAVRGALIMVVGSAGFLFVDELGPLVYALRFLHGVAFALTWVALGALVTDVAPPERMGQALGLFGVTMLSTNAVAPAAAEEIAARFGWEPAFIGAAAASLLAFALMRGLEDKWLPPQDTEIPGLWQTFKQPRALWYCAISALTGCAFGAMFTFSQPFALEVGIENVRGFFLAYAATSLLMRVGLGAFADRAGRSRVAVGTLVIYALSVLFMAELQPGRLPWIGAAFGIAHGLFYPAMNALALERAGDHERGKVMALFIGAFNAGWALGGLILGQLAEAAGYPAVFRISALGAALALALLLGSREVRADLVQSSSSSLR